VGGAIVVRQHETAARTGTRLWTGNRLRIIWCVVHGAVPLDALLDEVALEPHRKVDMRSRLALWVAAAIVFAPGWNGPGQPEPPRGGDLAVRILAPTFDEAQVREVASDIKQQVRGRRYAKPSRPIPMSPGAVGLALGATAFALLSLLSVSRERLIRCIPLRTGFSRAPPLQLA
jgi:hypothetical protein